MPVRIKGALAEVVYDMLQDELGYYRHIKDGDVPEYTVICRALRNAVRYSQKNAREIEALYGVTVYRGFTSVDGQAGLLSPHWTTDPRMALFFATRFAELRENVGKYPYIATHTIRPGDPFFIASWYTDRDEGEVLLDPNRLVDIPIKVRQCYRAELNRAA